MCYGPDLSSMYVSSPTWTCAVQGTVAAFRSSRGEHDQELSQEKVVSGKGGDSRGISLFRVGAVAGCSLSKRMPVE